MRDRGLLLISVGLLAVASWAFWHFVAEDAIAVFSTILLLWGVLDSIRLA